MSKFLSLIEEFDPKSTEDPKWKLIDFLKSKGVNVSLVKNTDMLYIDTGTDTVCVTVSNKEEEDEASNLVNDIAKDPADKLNPQARQVAQTNAKLAPKALQNVKIRQQNLQKELQKPIKSTY